MIGAKIKAMAIGLAATLALGGCYDDGRYGGMSVGAGYYGGGWYDDYYGGYGRGWYDGYYYPGTGYYVYDRRGTRHRWRDRDRRYWQQRRGEVRRDARRDWREERRDARRDWRQDRRGWRQDRRETRRDWRDNRREWRSERRQQPRPDRRRN